MARWVLAALVGVIAVAGASLASAHPEHTATVEVTVWRQVADPSRLFVSTRPAGGTWRTLNTPLDMSARSRSGRFHQSNAVRVEVTLGGGATATVEVTVWRQVASPSRLFVSTRPAGGTWRTLNTPLDMSARSRSGRFHQSNAVRVEVTLPEDDLPEAEAYRCERDCPHERHLAEKRSMLALINEARAEAGLAPLTLGENDAAQIHAQAMLAGCFASHWGADGLTPAMRYSLTGGEQTNAENVSGLDICITASDGYRAIGDIEEELRAAMAGLLASPGHRATILGASHRAVNLGLAWDGYNVRVVQHFEGGYVEYAQRPTIEDGRLTLSGRVQNGPRFATARDLAVQVTFDPPPHALTRGQLARTSCYSSGLPVAALRPPAPSGRTYLEDEFTRGYAPCPSPYDVPADAPAPRTPEEARALWRAAYEASRAVAERPVTGRWVTARAWRAAGVAFSLEADLSAVLARHGAGVYTLTLWGSLAGERVVISEYAIFHEATPPAAYR